MKIALFILLGYMVLATFVFAAIDDKDQNLLKEYKRIKGTLTGVFFWVFWPLIVYKWINRNKNESNKT